MQYLLLQVLHGGHKLLLQVIDGDTNIPFLPLHHKLLLRCDPQIVDGELIQLAPVLVGDFFCRIEELHTLGGVVVEVIGGEAALLVFEAVRVEAD